MAKKPFCGMFLGGDLGVSLGGFKESVTQDQTLIEKVNVQSSGLTGALSLGGAYTFENGLFFGGGLYGGLSRLQASHHRESASSDLDLKFKSSNFFGLHLQPGFVVGKETPVVFHLIGGVEFAKCKFNISSTREDLATANRVVEGNTSSKRLRGVSIGAGMSGMVSKGISLGLKFIHNRY
ncbi:hypothetical protein DAPPUDRAFT_100118 [Daphnia pulex]|uniref:Outer membrane protein beta-barrel domain-containing protein n=1 Tax=Daphnia pulex TaxID=6669 RepID=E9G9E7_DAPPU|nr:hypothetical protein DAPPUDRAFT_100118 [Daphnia pulex]|eukprot:EFX83547.1 hypothetical protein DAPPUDRAFT_100118 [Daphnia pulex]